MVRVFSEDGDDYILAMTGDNSHDAMIISNLIGGEFNSIYLDDSSALLYNKTKGEWGKGAVLNKKATDHISQNYGIVMPVPGLAIVINVDDFMVTQQA
tara:strand:- start:512 stop:805 length:294 start_codon:yes stop_codon:yes gene_type:complete